MPSALWLFWLIAVCFAASLLCTLHFIVSNNDDDSGDAAQLSDVFCSHAWPNEIGGPGTCFSSLDCAKLCTQPGGFWSSCYSYYSSADNAVSACVRNAEHSVWHGHDLCSAAASPSWWPLGRH
mmetsp:Transcript_7852/g.19244  ORF Transcript_7852/g.19244 Transcript_7852/m.19244 type:complete len:123 (+) Transcript_7852:1682-2050(+)